MPWQSRQARPRATTRARSTRRPTSARVENEGRRSSSAASLAAASKGTPGAFFAFTSNVDAHSLSVFGKSEVRECHGNSEVWQCAHRKCPGRPSERPSNGPHVGAAAAGDTAAAMAEGGVGSEAPTEESTVSSSGACCAKPRWPVPPAFRFRVNDETMLAEQGPAQARHEG